MNSLRIFNYFYFSLIIIHQPMVGMCFRRIWRNSAITDFLTWHWYEIPRTWYFWPIASVFIQLRNETGMIVHDTQMQWNEQINTKIRRYRSGEFQDSMVQNMTYTINRFPQLSCSASVKNIRLLDGFRMLWNKWRLNSTPACVNTFPNW